MKTRSATVCWGLCLGLLFAGCGSKSDEVQERCDNFVKALNARLDIAPYTSESGALIQASAMSKSEIATGIQKIYVSYPNASVKIESSKLTIVGDQASFSLTGTVTYLEDGVEVRTRAGSAVVGWALEDGEWRVTSVAVAE